MQRNSKRKGTHLELSKGKQSKKQKTSIKNGKDFRRSLGQKIKGIPLFNSSTSSEDEESSPCTDSKQLLCHASGHQGENTPFLYHYPGQQCGGIALTALLYSTVHSVNSWRVADLDKLLIAGDRLHFFQVCCLRFKIGNTQKLTVDELPTKLTAFNHEFDVDTEVLGGSTSQNAKERGLLDLERVLEDCVRNNSFGIVLRFQDYFVACINYYSEWFLFDSHARDRNGMVDGNGKAVLLKFSNSEALASHVSAFQRGDEADTSFEALVLRKMHRKATNHQDEMRITLVPPVVLVRYTSKFGNVQLDSHNLQNLEHGYLIDDNLMDFVLFYKAEEKSILSFSDDTMHIFSSCFYKKLTDFDPNRIRNWTKRVNIFSKDFVIIPVCMGSHWMLVIIKMNHGAGISMMILDSANHSSQRPSLTRRPSIERLINNYLRDEWVAKMKHQNKSENISFVEVNYPDVPQQPNQTDCGVYVMKFFIEFLNNLPLKQWPHWTPKFSHHAVMQLRTNTMFLIQELASKDGLGSDKSEEQGWN